MSKLFGMALEGFLTQLEAFSDEFERLAVSPEQVNLAQNFKLFVADFERAAIPHRPLEREKKPKQSEIDLER